MKAIDDILPRKKGVVEHKKRRMQELGVVYKKGTKSHYQACEVFSASKLDKNSCVINIGFTTF